MNILLLLKKETLFCFLLELEKYKYMFIQNFIYTFETTDKIIKYASNLGYNGVNYPFGYGEENIYIFLLINTNLYLIILL